MSGVGEVLPPLPISRNARFPVSSSQDQAASNWIQGQGGSACHRPGGVALRAWHVLPRTGLEPPLLPDQASTFARDPRPSLTPPHPRPRAKGQDRRRGRDEGRDPGVGVLAQPHAQGRRRPQVSLGPSATTSGRPSKSPWPSSTRGSRPLMGQLPCPPPTTLCTGLGAQLPPGPLF